MTTDTRTREQAFVARLWSLVNKDERGALAGLRRGLGKEPAEAFEAHRYIAPSISEDASVWQERCYYLIASLFALHAPKATEADEARSLGSGMARVAELNRAGGESIERRFTALLACDREALPDHLRHAVQLLKSAEVPVAWARLLRDIQFWDRDGRNSPRFVWARDFWRGRAAVEAENTETPSAGTIGSEHSDRE